VNLGQSLVQVKSWAESRNLTYMIMLDTYGSVWNNYGMGYIPHNVVLDKDMVVLYTYFGYEESKIIRIIDEQLAIAAIAEGEKDALLDDFFLSQNYPNPFNGPTQFEFSLSRGSQVSITLLSIDGKEIRTLIDDYRSAGNYRVLWDGKDASGITVASGVYLIKMSTDFGITTRKILKLN